MITETDAVQMAIMHEDGHYLFASYEQTVPVGNTEVLSRCHVRGKSKGTPNV